jgi:hypothetical protein
MYACPSCASRSITFLHKWLSWSAAPAKCSHCGAGCAIAIVDASGIAVAAALFVTFSGFVAVAVHAVYPLLAGVLLATGYYFWRQHRARLMPITAQETATARRSGWVALVAWLLPGFLS